MKNEMQKREMKAITLYIIMACWALCAQTGRAGDVVVGAAMPECYMKHLKGRRVALFSNQTGMVSDRHTLDILLGNGVDVVTIFSPEHGFRGQADAGEKVGSSVDGKTGVPIYSLYGAKGGVPDEATMRKIDLVVTDIQDVGLRYYTYYITMVKLMDQCARHGKRMVILDRPNPNGFYVDGPILDMKYKSGVGALPIPVVHGMTLGELARMANGEGWLEGGKRCRLTVIPCRNYTHRTLYRLPIAPSPNLPNMLSVYLYPSLCYFEGTDVSLGRGTDKPFQQFGHPDMKGYAYSFTPESRPGAKDPPQRGKRCYGRDLSSLDEAAVRRQGLDLSYLVEAYRNLNIGDRFFTPFFEKLIGVDYVRQMIEAGNDAEDIKAKWQRDVENFKKQRHKYLLYKE
ncbi:PF07075 family protein [Segatella baroniae F0067]|uniref:PF07075 family protein n=2 Tax=Segatella baroniae TaxID=305719 RepID=U2QN73_9BACT|nr:PF07075 family protein [Segatella baroniae F0067]